MYDRCESGKNKTHTFSKKRVQIYFLPAIIVLPLCSLSLELFQPLATWTEVWQAIPGVSKWVMATIDEVILSNSLEDHRTSVVCLPPQCAMRTLSPLRRGDESAGKRSHINRSSSTERVRLLQPLLPHPPKRWWPATYSRSKIPESCPGEKVVQDDHFETEPRANMPRGLFMSLDLKDA